jgi:ABC-type transport system involved in cytochrome c biogenesis permease component
MEPIQPNFSKEMKMNHKKSAAHLIFTAVYFSLAVVTLIPLASASKTSLLGYKSLCSFSPISTIGLILLAGMHILLQKRSLAKI